MRSTHVAPLFRRLTAASFAVLALLASPVRGQTSPCCPADLDGDGLVGPTDLALVLGAWGSSGGDVDGDGSGGPNDLAMLLGAWGSCSSDPCLLTRVIGTVLFESGDPVEAAVVVTNVGGMAVSGADGSFGMDLELDEGVLLLRVTAVATIRGETYVGSTSVDDIVFGGVTDAGVITIVAGGSCGGDRSWLPTFGSQPGVDGPSGQPGVEVPIIAAFATFDEGSQRGAALYVGGTFTSAGGSVANRIARYDGQTWSALGAGFNGVVLALTIFDDGSGGGPALYAGGAFTAAGSVEAQRVARWDGSAWTALGSGLNGPVRALATYDQGIGGGAVLVAGGDFTAAGGAPASHIARWDGSAWSPLGFGVDETVRALATFDDPRGGGNSLYVGGDFATAGEGPAHRIARWDGATWSALGSGMENSVHALTTFDDGSGSGPMLYAGGDFVVAGGVPVHGIARWDGAAWSALGLGLSNPAVIDAVFTLASVDDGSPGGAALYAGGQFTFAGGKPASRIARWDGKTWSAVGSGVNSWVNALTTFDDGAGRGPALYAGGWFTLAGEANVKRIARWDGQSWSALGSGLNGDVLTLSTFDDGSGSGPALYAGGTFTTAGGISANRIARWDGATWSPLGAGTNGAVIALASFDDGSGRGPALYAGGSFTVAGGIEAHRIARWDGETWTPLGAGMNHVVLSLLAIDEPASGGPVLYAGGEFQTAGGQPASRIARWDGSTWSSVGSGFNGNVRALAIFDEGNGRGPLVYAGGEFTAAGGVPANRIARWDGATWSALGSGMNNAVFALATFDPGLGGKPVLVAGGLFNHAGGTSASRIAQWDGATWSPLGLGVNNAVVSLTTFDDHSGSGPALYVGGSFTAAGGKPASRLARWSGTTWSGLSSAMNNAVSALVEWEDGRHPDPALIVGGGFTASPAGDSYVAQWGCAP